jgi:hypothetical protein
LGAGKSDPRLPLRKRDVKLLPAVQLLRGTNQYSRAIAQDRVATTNHLLRIQQFELRRPRSEATRFSGESDAYGSQQCVTTSQQALLQSIEPWGRKPGRKRFKPQLTLTGERRRRPEQAGRQINALLTSREACCPCAA